MTNKYNQYDQEELVEIYNAYLDALRQTKGKVMAITDRETGEIFAYLSNRRKKTRFNKKDTILIDLDELNQSPFKDISKAVSFLFYLEDEIYDFTYPV